MNASLRLTFHLLPISPSVVPAQQTLLCRIFLHTSTPLLPRVVVIRPHNLINPLPLPIDGDQALCARGSTQGMNTGMSGESTFCILGDLVGEEGD